MQLGQAGAHPAKVEDIGEVGREIAEIGCAKIKRARGDARLLKGNACLRISEARDTPDFVVLCQRASERLRDHTGDAGDQDFFVADHATWNRST